jgi:hypothetical protein
MYNTWHALTFVQLVADIVELRGKMTMLEAFQHEHEGVKGKEN